MTSGVSGNAIHKSGLPVVPPEDGFKLNSPSLPGRLPPHMIRLLLLGIVLLLLTEVSAECATTASERLVRIAGHEYLSLRDFAARWQLDMRWVRQDEELRLTNSAMKLWFKVNSQKTEVNDVSVFLSFPVVLQTGEAYISPRDAREVLMPLLSPARYKPTEKIKTVALFAGHGGKDNGYQVGPEFEKRHTLLLAREVRKKLIERGLKVMMIRDDDRFVQVEDGADAGNRRRADLHVSLHYNSAGANNSEVQGGETYCYTLPGTPSTNGGSARNGRLEPGDRNSSKNILLAYEIQKAMVRQLGSNDRGVRHAQFVVLKLAEKPAVLVEASFMSNPEEMRRIKDPVHRQRTARAIADGIMSYKRLVGG
ncbi:MAG: N-acetylmuramoyl-L-alanine amidase [Pedosphaera sp.]|nr:N-acetylmuramoyl-L-alanine amidase [Pedosphaera sp.]